MPGTARPAESAVSAAAEVEKGEGSTDQHPEHGSPEHVAVPIDTAALMAALVAETDQLLTALTALRRVPHSSERSLAEHQRWVAGEMLIRLGMFADRAAHLGVGPGPVPNLTGPLFELAMAMRALSEGDAHPMLAPDAKKRRAVIDGEEDAARGLKPKLPLYELSARAEAAAAMQFAMDCGMKRKDAAAAVAKALADSKVLAGVRGTPALAVQRWRDQILELQEKRTLAELPSSEPAERHAACAFNARVELTKTLASKLGLPPNEAANRIISALRNRNAP